MSIIVDYFTRLFGRRPEAVPTPAYVPAEPAHFAIAVPFLFEVEGCELTPYKDVAGNWTIGVGHLCLPSEFPLSPISQVQAENLLRKDMESADACINTHVQVRLNENQRAALLSFIFNLGCGAFAESTLLRKLNFGDYAGAAQQFLRWCYADGARVDGLYKRRIKEQALFMKGMT